MSTTTPVASDTPEQKANRFAKPRTLIGGSVILAAILGGVYLANTWRNVSTDDAQIDGRLVPIAPKISGYVSQLLIDDNQLVHKGQTIARIDPRDMQTAVDRAQAALESAEAQAAASSGDVPLTSNTTDSSILAAQANLSAAEAELLQARLFADKAHHADTSQAIANVAERKADYTRAKADLVRMKALAEKHEISNLQYDRYVATEQMAKSGLDAAEQALLAQKDTAVVRDAAVQTSTSKVRQAEAQLSQARADHERVGIRTHDAAAMQSAVAVAKANLEQAKLQLSYTEIIAPQDGRVTRRTVESGAYVSPGQTLLTIVPTHDIWVTANFKETQLRHVRSGDRAEVRIDESGKTFSGHVDSIANATGSRLSLLPPENATGNFVKIVQRIPVKIVLDQEAIQSNSLSVGSNVDATIHTR